MVPTECLLLPHSFPTDAQNRGQLGAIQRQSQNLGQSEADYPVNQAQEELCLFGQMFYGQDCQIPSEAIKTSAPIGRNPVTAVTNPQGAWATATGRNPAEERANGPASR